MASYYDEVDRILEAHRAAKAARKAVKPGDEKLNILGTRLLKPKPVAPKDWHDDRCCNWHETDDNAGRSSAQIQSGDQIPKEKQTNDIV